MNKSTKFSLNNQRILYLLNQRMEEMAALPAQKLGPLTTPFKITAFYLKNYSLILFPLLATALFLLLKIFWGERLTTLASVLQQAF